MKYKCLSGSGITKLFLSLPRKLYSKSEITQDEITERKILSGTHILSESFSVFPFVVVDENGEAVGRCALTCYADRDEAFLGFFECINDEEVCGIMFEEVFKCAAEQNKRKIIGPVDASFWIKYRFKIDNFDKKMYACEPYNKEYYANLWEKFGFEVCERYFSNQIRAPLESDENKKCRQRFETMTKRGYTIENPNCENFTEKLYEVFSLLIKLYSGFPCFTVIDREQFGAMFSGLKYALNYDMVKLAYKDGELAGFSISLPDFGNASCGKITLPKLLKILRIKYFPKQFINLYMGVGANHLGLGSMLAESIKHSLVEKKCSAVSALIHEGKVTGNYYNGELSQFRYNYILMSRELQSFQHS